MLTFSSSNPETLDLFRSVYYRPKIVLLILLFIAFPSTDTFLHQPHSNLIEVNPTSAESLSNNPTPNPRHLTSSSAHHQATIHSPSIEDACPDAYLDHRNNIICPHAPKRLKSVRQRWDEVLQELKTTLRRWTNTQTALEHLDSRHHLNRARQISHRLSLDSTDDRWNLRVALCAPIANPFTHLVILLHTLFFIQALSLVVEDALIKDACASTHIIGSFRSSSSSWLKRWSRFRFRLANHWSKRSFWEPFAFWAASVLLLATIGSEALGDTGSWQTGGVWHDLPFRTICRRPNTNALAQPESEIRVSIIGLPVLKLLSFLLDRVPFVKPARTLVLIECCLGLVCLCQPAQHFLPQKILPKVLRIPSGLLRSAPQRLAVIGQSPSAGSSENGAQVVEVEVETKWVLSVLVEACVYVAAIASYFVVMVHLPYTSYYWFPLLLSVSSIKSCIARLKNLHRSSLHTIHCLESVLRQFGPEPIINRQQEWRCSICFEDEECSEDSDSPIEASRVRGGERCVALGCRHQFHAKCLVKWLHYQTFCPICHKSVEGSPSP